MSTAPVSSRHDVVIAGGGLAGLTLALHLKQTFADLDILVLERRSHPVPVAAHKVGESTVEIGADYLANVLGLKPHLMAGQIKKFGFRFFSSQGRRDIGNVSEIGASRFLTVPSWQIDRGIFENFLGEEATRRGIAFAEQAVVRSITLADGKGEGGRHRIAYAAAGLARVAEATWLVDACGRAGLLKRKLGLTEPNGHDANAVWFRIGERLVIDDWVADPAWRDRCDPKARWQSTNHMVGDGYWVWLIPLASGSHSIGIVCDAKKHPLETMKTFELAMTWLQTFQPSVFDWVDSRRDKLQDFAFFRDFSYGCKQVFSAERWALTGESGLFLDPFYSPGSDFIAIANTYIVDLVARDRAERPIAARAQVWDQLFHSFYESTLAIYENQYGLFGDAELLPVKVIWDYTYYWGILAQFFFHRRLTDLSAFAALKDELAHCRALNIDVQSLLREWSASRPEAMRANPKTMHDQASLPWFAELNRSLADTLDDAAFRDRIRFSTRQMRALAAEIRARAAAAGASSDSLDATLRAGARFGRLDAATASGRPGGSMLFADSPNWQAAAPLAAAA